MFLWVKAFHLISVVTWFAALFYLPRLFVYHAMTDATDTAGNERFKIMERKLLNGIMTPSMILAVALGIWMLMLVPDLRMTCAEPFDALFCWMEETTRRNRSRKEVAENNNRILLQETAQAGTAPSW